MIYKSDNADPGRVIIYRPGLVYASQYALSSYSPLSVGVRNSCIDPVSIVLDVVDPIVCPWKEQSEGLIVIDRHHRLAEAARRRIGIEARLVRRVEDLDSVPEGCFHNLSNEDIAFSVSRMSYYREITIGSGVDRVEDLV